jgi:S-(hydroxymethyl)glutathione dehydrogenase / alcohol dehydrogenase
MGAGTLAEQTLVPAAGVVKVDPSLPLDLAALLGCAVTTGVGAVVRTANVRPGETVLVIGCGGVGLAAIQGARLAGAARIIAADKEAAQLPAATANGATDTIDATEGDVVTVVRQLTGGAGVDHGVEVVGKAATIRAAYDATRRGGTVTLVGAAAIDETVTFPALSLMADGKTTRGCVYGASDPARDIPALANLAMHGRLDLEALVTRRIGIEQVEAAFTDMAAGRGARSVACFGPADA